MMSILTADILPISGSSHLANQVRKMHKEHMMPL